MPEEPFQIPQPFLKKLYELTGSANHNKGFLLFLIDNKGNPRPINSPMDISTNMCLRKCAEIYLDEMNHADGIGSLMEDEDE